MSITVLIEVFNEEKNIVDCIKSAQLLTQTVIVVDMQSTDHTVEIAKKMGATVIPFDAHPLYVEPAREFGIRQIKTDWVMILDADERMTKELADEILYVIASEAKQSKDDKTTYYKIPRKNIFGEKTCLPAGRWLQHGGWWPDEQMRLIKISAFKTWPSNIHSTPQIHGRMGHLKEPFLHYFHGDLQSMVEKTLIFEDIESELLFKAGRQVSTPTFFRKFFGELWRRLFKNKGFMDGEIGIIESIYQAFSKTITYLFLYEKSKNACLPAGRAGLYDPYLDVMGGGEKHILSILQVLEKGGYDISLFWDQDLSSSIKNKLNLSFSNLAFIPNIFKSQSPIEKVKALNKFDIFFYVTDGSYFFSGAKKNIIFCMVPNPALYQMNLVNKLKTLNNQFIANSSYTQKLLQKWGIKSDVIYPYVTEDLLQTKPGMEKEKIILSVGRFFGHLHAKKHEEIIKSFLTFQKTHKDFKLVLIGGLKDEDKTYFQSLVKLVGDNKNILLKPNVPYAELVEYYRKSMFFWHFAGYGVDEKKHPEMVEHLGMAPLEAMAAGTVPFCYEAGGPKEIISDGENGFLFINSDKLLSKTEKVLKDENEYKKVQRKGQEYVKKYFSFEVFEKKVKEILL
mgnify:FL=1